MWGPHVRASSTSGRPILPHGHTTGHLSPAPPRPPRAASSPHRARINAPATSPRAASTPSPPSTTAPSAAAINGAPELRHRLHAASSSPLPSYKRRAGPPLHPAPFPCSPPSPQQRHRGAPPPPLAPAAVPPLRCFPLPSDSLVSFPPPIPFHALAVDFGALELFPGVAPASRRPAPPRAVRRPSPRRPNSRPSSDHGPTARMDLSPGSNFLVPVVGAESSPDTK
jgi:hypothetical protein